MARARGSGALLVLAAGAAGAEHFFMHAAGHVGMQMGAQDTNSGGMELFFRRRLAEGRAAGEGQLSPPGEAQKISEISAPVFKDVESEAKETKERNKWQCAICGRWEDPSGTSRRKCSSCGGPGFENKRATSSLSSTMALAGRNDGNDPKKRGPHRKKDVGQGQTDRDFMDEEKVVWGVGRTQK